MKANRKNDMRQESDKWQALMSRVMAVTGMTEEEYTSGVYESGLMYLGLYWQNNESWMGRWSSSRTFWVWWRNQWARKDELLIDTLETIVRNVISQGGYIGHTEKAKLKDVYLQEHSGEQSIREFKPNRVLTEMIGKEVSCEPK